MTRSQLRAAGISDDAIDRRVRSGRLHRVHPGVFALGHDALQPLARETAALLSVGFDAVLCAFTAGELWRLIPLRSTAEPPIDVLLPSRHAHARPGMTLHRTTTLERRDVRIHQGLPVTSPARTLLDLADRLTPRGLERAVEEALARRLTRTTQIEDAVARANGRRRARRLEALLPTAGTKYTRSGSERQMLELIRQAELPEPLVNTRLHGFEVDFYWPDYGLVLEVDGMDYHSSRFTFEHDRRKAAILTAHGLRVMRATGAQIDDEPLAVIARVAQILAITRPDRPDRPGN